MSDFEHAWPVILKHEGGYCNNAADPGGETNFGICKRSYPNVDIKNLTSVDAAAIYKRDWWDKYGYGQFPDQSIATKILDMAVNLGPSKAHKIAQEAAGCVPDGCLGPESIKALNVAVAPVLLNRMRTLQASYYQKIVDATPSRACFLAGWLKRARS